MVCSGLTSSRIRSLRFIARFAKQRRDAASEIAGEEIVKMPADEQIRRARVASIQPVEERLLLVAPGVWLRHRPEFRNDGVR